MEAVKLLARSTYVVKVDTVVLFSKMVKFSQINERGC
jgi:hypothetical protein